MPFFSRPGKPDIHYELDDFTDPWKEAPYIVLQHGFGRSSRFWYPWIPYLTRYYKMLRPDLRGLGRSSRDFDLDNEIGFEFYFADLTRCSIIWAPAPCIIAANHWADYWACRMPRCIRSGCGR
jgi:3-oxoadipate enol-lactonase